LLPERRKRLRTELGKEKKRETKNPENEEHSMHKIKSEWRI
jgi:hypothetical protein